MWTGGAARKIRLKYDPCIPDKRRSRHLLAKVLQFHETTLYSSQLFYIPYLGSMSNRSRSVKLSRNDDHDLDIYIPTCKILYKKKNRYISMLCILGVFIYVPMKILVLDTTRTFGLSDLLSKVIYGPIFYKQRS